MNLKEWFLFTSKFVGTGPSSYEKKNLSGRGLTKVEKHCPRHHSWSPGLYGIVWQPLLRNYAFVAAARTGPHWVIGRQVTYEGYVMFYSLTRNYLRYLCNRCSTFIFQVWNEFQRANSRNFSPIVQSKLYIRGEYLFSCARYNFEHLITAVRSITIKRGLHTPTEECQITVRFKGHSRIVGHLTVEWAA
jgi:hypothetical protein